MMQVEEKPDVTYSDVGGCKEQIEKLREVVETPLLHVSSFKKITQKIRLFFINLTLTNALVLYGLAGKIRQSWN